MASVLAVLALAGAGFAVGAALSPDHADTRGSTSVTTAAARPVINAPGPAIQPPALVRVRHQRKAAKAKAGPKHAGTAAPSDQGAAGVAGIAAQQTPIQSAGGSGTGASKTKSQPAKTKSTDTSTVQPPPFDQHTTSGQ